MGEHTKIEWAHHTFNPWYGCTKVSPACDHCYAERDFDHRFGKVKWGAGQPRVRTAPANWRKPLQWNKAEFVQCPECGWRGEWKDADARSGCCPSCNHLPPRFLPARRRVFSLSLGDWLDNEVPIEWFVDMLDVIRRTPNLDWLLLSKRIGNWRNRLTAARDFVAELLGADDPETDALFDCVDLWLQGSAPSHLWIGATICNQEEADRDIPKLLQVPARVRFLSMEPLLGPVSFEGLFANPKNSADGTNALEELDWIIVGGESGPQARSMVLGLAKDIVLQCKEAGTPVFMKQLGARPTNREGEPHPISDRAGGIMAEWPEILRLQEFPA